MKTLGFKICMFSRKSISFDKHLSVLGTLGNVDEGITRKSVPYLNCNPLGPLLYSMCTLSCHKIRPRGNIPELILLSQIPKNSFMQYIIQSRFLNVQAL